MTLDTLRAEMEQALHALNQHDRNLPFIHVTRVLDALWPVIAQAWAARETPQLYRIEETSVAQLEAEEEAAARADSLSALVARLWRHAGRADEARQLDPSGSEVFHQEWLAIARLLREAADALARLAARTETTATAACIRCGVPMDEQVVRANHTIAYLMERCETAESARLAAPEAQQEPHGTERTSLIKGDDEWRLVFQRPGDPWCL